MNTPADIAQRYAAAVCREIEGTDAARDRDIPILRRMLAGLPVPRVDHTVRAKVVSLADYRLQRSMGVYPEV